jgi:hypothetical protein
MYSRRPWASTVNTQLMLTLAQRDSLHQNNKGTYLCLVLTFLPQVRNADSCLEIMMSSPKLQQNRQFHFRSSDAQFNVINILTLFSIFIASCLSLLRYQKIVKYSNGLVYNHAFYATTSIIKAADYKCIDIVWSSTAMQICRGLPILVNSLSTTRADVVEGCGIINSLIML